MKSCSCILPKFVMHVTNDQFSDKFDNSWKKMADFNFDNGGGLLSSALLLKMKVLGRLF